MVILNTSKAAALVCAILVAGCASGPPPGPFDSPIGEWIERYESQGGDNFGPLSIIDETRGVYTNSSGPPGKIEFSERDEQQRIWKGHWILPSGAYACSFKRGGSLYWGDYVFRFNEAYNRYTGYWNTCGEGQKFSTRGKRKRS